MYAGRIVIGIELLAPNVTDWLRQHPVCKSIYVSYLPNITIQLVRSTFVIVTILAFEFAHSFCVLFLSTPFACSLFFVGSLVPDCISQTSITETFPFFHVNVIIIIAVPAPPPSAPNK